jgi:2-polyprenyl-3-methyl-5-hydroxy-6-metoxy-1,4-benzoquinol methylase
MVSANIVIYWKTVALFGAKNYKTNARPHDDRPFLMSLFIDTTYRSNSPELMDDFTMEGDLLRDTLDKLGAINKWLGGNRITISGIKKLLQNKPKDKTYKIIDLGCGHGDLLRLIADYARKNGYTFQLIGIDANHATVAYAQELSKNYPEISFIKMDVFSEAFDTLEYDIALCTLFLHHFDEPDLSILLKKLAQSANLGLVINDLQRSKTAYTLFKAMGWFISNHMVVQDGLTSILRAFKRHELEQLSHQLNLKSQIRWRWAFRYQWIIKT